MKALNSRLVDVYENTRRLIPGGAWLRIPFEGAAALIISLAFVATDVRAAPVEFQFTGTGSGTLNSVAFSDRNFSVMISDDTDSIDTSNPDVPFIEFVNGTIDIDGLGVSTFLVPIWVLGNDGLSPGNCECVGFGNDFHGDLIYVEKSGVGIASWDMTTSLGPIFKANPFIMQFWNVQTDSGLLGSTRCRK